MIRYSRRLYPHWGKSPVKGYADVRQYMIGLAMVGDYALEKGVVTGGLWYCFYTGKIYDIEVHTPDLDHVLTLNGAHERGASSWTREQRKKFANDPDNLVVVFAGSNRQKSAMIGRWLPPNIANGSEYLERIKYLFEKYETLKPTVNDRMTYQFLVGKVAAWEKGIKLDKVKDWFTSVFNWHRSPSI